MLNEKEQKALEVMCYNATDSVRRWKHLKENGGSDTFYPDGVNLNLLRNHLIYYKGKIREFCAEKGVDLPEEAYLPNLPYTDSNYFVNPASDRATRIMSGPSWRFGNQEIPDNSKYDETLLSFL